MSRNNIILRTVIGVKYSQELILPFIDYYRALGIADFRITLNHKPSELQELEICKDILNDCNISPVNVWIGSYKEETRMQHLNNLITDVSDDDWIVTADCDEFQKYPGDDILKFIETLDSKKILHVKGALVDRLSLDGTIPQGITENVPLDSQFPVYANMERIYDKLPCNKAHSNINGEWLIHKIPLHKSELPLGSGNHFFQSPGYAKVGASYPKPIQISHIKWYGDVLKNIHQSMIDHPSITRAKQGYVDYLKSNDTIELSRVELTRSWLTETFA